MIKVLIADEQELIRESLKIVLNSNNEIVVVGTAIDGQDIIRFTKENDVDVVIMGVRMPKIDGLQCTKILKDTKPHIKIIIHTTCDEERYISEAILGGVDAYLLKGEAISKIVDAIKAAFIGKMTINEKITKKIVEMYTEVLKNQEKPIEYVDDNTKSLTRHEWKIIKQVELGNSNKQIASNLFLSEGTVRNYLSNVLSKLELKDRTQLAIWALKHQNSYNLDA